MKCLMLRGTVQGNTPLVLAAARGDVGAVELLIAARANLEAKHVVLLLRTVSCLRSLVFINSVFKAVVLCGGFFV
jgi:ankyrin repeat protein